VVGVGGGDGVVGDHDDGRAEPVHGVAEQREDLGGGGGVEGAGGLVAEDHVGAGDEGAGDGDPLLLAAGELGGPPGALVGEADLAEDLGGAAPVGAAPGEPQREQHVLLDGERGQQVEGLEDEAEAAAAQFGELVLAEACDLGAAEPDGAGGGAVESGGALQEGRLAGAGRSHHGGEAAVREAQVDAAQGVHGAVSPAVQASYSGEFDGCRRGGGVRCHGFLRTFGFVLSNVRIGAGQGP